MRTQSFRLKTSTLAILDQDGKKVPIPIPAGATVEVTAESIDGSRFVPVRWEDKAVMIFAIDLRERDELVGCRMFDGNFSGCQSPRELESM